MEWQKTWESNEKEVEPEVEEMRLAYPSTMDEWSIAGANHLLITPNNFRNENAHRLVVYIHGGGYTLFSPESSVGSSLPAAHYLGAKVLALRYPLAWQKPYPAARDLVVAVYKELLTHYASQKIAMFGDSAGGALLMSAVLTLRDEGIPLPSVLGLLSPWADLTKTGDSQTLLRGADPILDYDLNLKASADLYAGGINLNDPRVSPLYADFSKGFPPCYISTGTRDLFLSHCARLQRKLIDAKIANQLIVYEGMWHVFQSFLIPEQREAWRDMAAFFERHWARD